MQPSNSLAPKIFTGIGSREAPEDILLLFEALGERLARAGFVLRSGHARGCDQAFERGAARIQRVEDLEIYLPKVGFQGDFLHPVHIPPRAYEIAAQLHPAWHKLDTNNRNFMARNAQQIEGAQLDTPTRFVLCWTPDGCIDAAQRTRKTGGTGQAIAHASKLGIPVYNAARGDHRALMESYVQRSIASRTPSPSPRAP